MLCILDWSTSSYLFHCRLIQSVHDWHTIQADVEINRMSPVVPTSVAFSAQGYSVPAF